MNHHHDSHWLGRAWTAFTGASAAAVAIHYAAPWKRSAAAPRPAREQDGCAA